MLPRETLCVASLGGLRGTVNTAAWPLDGSRSEVLVELERGAPMLVPLEAPVREDDGPYRLPLGPAVLEHPCGRGHARQEPPQVVPVIFEEVVVVEKRLPLKEELHITQRPVETRTPQRVTVRREDAVVERVNRRADENNPCP